MTLIMSEKFAPRGKTASVTCLGLFLSLFGIILAREVVSYFSPTLTLTAAVWKESLIWLCAAALLIVIRRGERLPLSAIGLGTSPWWKSILWGLGISLPCFLVAGILAAFSGYGHAPESAAFDKFPLWLITLIVLRAGVVEEFFYRGYAITRLEAVGLARFWSVGIPLVIFSVAHWRRGWANIVIALALGLILSGFYVWRRDLVANMVGHGVVDFVANALPKLFS
jgi:membrane protease YdiL (CAAX protease family)